LPSVMAVVSSTSYPKHGEPILPIPCLFSISITRQVLFLLTR
jgi:hypothetical protein